MQIVSGEGTHCSYPMISKYLLIQKIRGSKNWVEKKWLPVETGAYYVFEVLFENDFLSRSS